MTRALVLVVALATCRPSPPPVATDAGTSTPASWTDTARQIVTTCRWALPALRATVALLPIPSEIKAGIVNAVQAVEATALPRLDSAITTYLQAGGGTGRCEVNAAARGLAEALLGVTATIADAGWAPAREIGQLIDGIGGVVDALTPACTADAGWSSAGRSYNARLAAIGAGRRLQPMPPLRSAP